MKIAIATWFGDLSIVSLVFLRIIKTAAKLYCNVDEGIHVVTGHLTAAEMHMLF